MPLNLLADVDQWTYETVLQIAGDYSWEPGAFDFKEVMHGGGDVVPSIRRAACSMANIGGGYIIFGVKDRVRNPDLTPEQLIVGIPVRGDLRKELGEKLSAITPTISFEMSSTPIAIPKKSPEHGLVVAAIPMSPLRPHQVRETGVYYRRGPGGAATAMDHYEVRDQMLLTYDTVRKVRLLRIELREYRRCLDSINAVKVRGMTIERFETQSLKMLTIDASGVLAVERTLAEDIFEVASYGGRLNRILDKINNSPRAGLDGHPVVDQDTDSEYHRFIVGLSNVLNRCTEALLQHFGQFS